MPQSPARSWGARGLSLPLLSVLHHGWVLGQQNPVCFPPRNHPSSTFPLAQGRGFCWLGSVSRENIHHTGAWPLTWHNGPADRADTMVAHSGAGTGPAGRGCRQRGRCTSLPHSTSSSRCLNQNKKVRIRTGRLDLNRFAHQDRSLQ